MLWHDVQSFARGVILAGTWKSTKKSGFMVWNRLKVYGSRNFYIHKNTNFSALGTVLLHRHSTFKLVMSLFTLPILEPWESEPSTQRLTAPRVFVDESDFKLCVAFMFCISYNVNPMSIRSVHHMRSLMKSEGHGSWTSSISTRKRASWSNLVYPPPRAPVDHNYHV